MSILASGTRFSKNQWATSRLPDYHMCGLEVAEHGHLLF